MGNPRRCSSDDSQRRLLDRCRSRTILIVIRSGIHVTVSTTSSYLSFTIEDLSRFRLCVIETAAVVAISESTSHLPLMIGLRVIVTAITDCTTGVMQI